MWRVPAPREYIDNEKFEYKARDWDAAAESGRTLAPYLTRLNAIRREHPALGDLQNLTVHESRTPPPWCTPSTRPSPTGPRTP